MKSILTVLARAAVLTVLSGTALAGGPALAPLAATGMDAMADTMRGTNATKLSHGLASLLRQTELAKAAGSAISESSTDSRSADSRNLGGLQVMGPAAASGAVRVEILATAGNTDALLAELAAVGARAAKASGNLIHAWVPVAALAQLGASNAVRFVREGGMVVTHSGAVTSQGDAAQRSDSARAQFGVNGTGAGVGILSNSYNVLGGAEQGVAQGDLPGPGNPNGFFARVNVLSEGAQGSPDEGRAMAEIVHDVAPGAKLSFYAPNSYADHADGIRQLVAAGATVVVDDLGWFFEPWFQEGPIAKAAADVARSHNVPVVTSAGNSGNLSVDARFLPVAVNELQFNGQSVGRWLLHGFGFGAALTTQVRLNPGARVSLVLQWDEPAASVTAGGAGAQSDLDLLVFKDAAATDVLVGATTNNLGGDPVEVVTLNLAADAAQPLTVYVGVGRRFGSSNDGGLPGRFKIVPFGGGSGSTQVGGAFNGSTIVGHNNSPALITTCAVRYDAISAAGGPRVQASSALGGTRFTRDANGSPNFFAQPVAKPDLCGPDAGNNSFFGDDFDGDGRPNFSGTSAAAPHVAGVVALMQSAKNMQLRASAVRSILLRSTIDMDDPATPQFDFGFDFKTGFGFLDALTAVTHARNSR
jgi:hypothetical protein